MWSVFGCRQIITFTFYVSSFYFPTSSSRLYNEEEKWMQRKDSHDIIQPIRFIGIGKRHGKIRGCTVGCCSQKLLGDLLKSSLLPNQSSTIEFSSTGCFPSLLTDNCCSNSSMSPIASFTSLSSCSCGSRSSSYSGDMGGRITNWSVFTDACLADFWT